MARGPSAYLRLIRVNRNFRLLWLGAVISFLGDWFNLIATATLVNRLSGAGMAIGSLFVVRMLAPFLTSPLGGVLADRYDRRTLMVVTDLLRAVVVLGFLWIDEAGELWLLYLLTAVQLGLMGLFVPAHSALTPQIVSREDLGVANALGNATWSVMQALGTALGGLFAAGFGLAAAFWVDSLTFVVSAILLAGIRAPEPAGYAAPGQAATAKRPPAAAAATGPGAAAAARGASERRPDDEPGPAPGLAAALGELWEGLGFLRRRPDLAALVLHKPASLLAYYGGLEVSLVALARTVFPMGHESSLSMGLAFSAFGVGCAIGPILSEWVTGDDEPSLCRALAVSYPVSAAGIALASTLVSFPVVLTGLAVAGAGGGIMWVTSSQLLMMEVPDSFRGRVFATEFALLTLGNAGGAALCGWALDLPWPGLRGVLVAISLSTLVPGVLWVVWLGARHSTAGGPGGREVDP